MEKARGKKKVHGFGIRPEALTGKTRSSKEFDGAKRQDRHGILKDGRKYSATVVKNPEGKRTFSNTVIESSSKLGKRYQKATHNGEETRSTYKTVKGKFTKEVTPKLRVNKAKK